MNIHNIINIRHAIREFCDCKGEANLFIEASQKAQGLSIVRKEHGILRFDIFVNGEYVMTTPFLRTVMGHAIRFLYDYDVYQITQYSDLTRMSDNDIYTNGTRGFDIESEDYLYGNCTDCGEIWEFCMCDEDLYGDNSTNYHDDWHSMDYEHIRQEEKLIRDESGFDEIPF